MKMFFCSVKIIVSAGLIGLTLMGCGSMAARDTSATSAMSDSDTSRQSANEASRRLHMGY